MTVRSNKQVIDAWVLEGIFGRGNRSSGLISIDGQLYSLSGYGDMILIGETIDCQSVAADFTVDCGLPYGALVAKHSRLAMDVADRIVPANLLTGRVIWTQE